MTTKYFYTPYFKLALLATSVLSIALGVLLGMTLSGARAGDRSEQLYQEIETLTQAMTAIEERAMRPPSTRRLIDGAIRGMARTVDDHTQYLSKRQYDHLKEAGAGRYGGTGIHIGYRGKTPVIARIEPNSPASANLLVGDILSSVDTIETSELSRNKLRDKLHGAPGTQLTLGIKRGADKQALAVTLTRTWITLQNWSRKDAAPGIMYLKIPAFTRGLTEQIERMLHEAGPERGLILDLRGNPGGLFEEAVGISDLFVGNGLLAQVVGRHHKRIKRRHAQQDGTQPNYPIAILIDAKSASSAEITASTLRAHKRARLFGQPSKGKGSVQTLIDLSGGGGLKLTVAEYLTPDGDPIEDAAIIPDVVTEAKHPTATEDAAIAWLLSQS